MSSDIFFVTAAPFVGSFLGLLSYRLPRQESIAWGRSKCPHCGTTLTWMDLVPLLSWMTFQGHCRYCGGRIDPTYPILETGALIVAIWSVTAPHYLAPWILVAVGWALLLLAAIDFRTHLLPNILTLPLLASGLMVEWKVSGEIWGHIVGAAVGFALLFCISHLYRQMRGKEGLGLGDAKLLSAAGAWVSWQGLPSVLLIASASGLAYAGWRALRSETSVSDIPIAFGPFIAIGFWLVLLLGPIALY